MDQTLQIICENSPTGLIHTITSAAIGDPQGPGFCHFGDVPGPGLFPRTAKMLV